VERRLRRSVVPGPIGAAALVWLLKYTRLYLALRDNHRFYYDFSHWEVRRTYLAMGRHLAGRGFLYEPDDVFFLGHGEVQDTLTGKLNSDDVLLRATVRRRQFTQDRDAETPKFMRGDQPLAPAGARTGEADIIGLAAGPGDVTAVARVLRDVSELSRVGRGEILVTHQTDPGWTPLFTRLGALVLETGSVLAHGASLAREYGLPAVTAAEGATRLIADGDLLTVDGSNGLVYIHRG
jgi:pyruvate,water dikinase